VIGSEFDDLVADIRENGQREPIVVHDGLILDGRNRYRACQVLGFEPMMVEWDQHGTPEAFVTSMNLHRRHLNESQRALIAAKITNMKRGDSLSQRRDDGIPSSTTSAAQAGEMLKVHRTTVNAAKKILCEGTPEEISQIERGEASVYRIAKAIRQGLSPAKRKLNGEKTRSDVGKNPERIQRMQINGEIWGRLRSALENLTSLPLPTEVAPIARAMDKARLVDDRLLRSLKWLEEFTDAWTRST
jgi:ParB-like chromosome segregation protein Spo0J